ncbi:MAG: LysM peptidoglycan-binding domain-containing protein [Luteolibacter sp.]
MVKPPAGASKTEPGLELAVSWKWWVAPSEKKEWGMPLPEALRPKLPDDPAVEVAKPVVERPDTYEVKKGDAIIKISKKFEMTAWQLKQFNDLKDDRIHIGQILQIPTPGELLTLVPPPPPPPPEPKKETGGKKKSNKAIVVPETVPEVDPTGEVQLELDNVRLQVFLDRELFSPGMIDGKSGAVFLKISEVYQQSHAEAANPALLKAKAEAAITEPYTHYLLRADDFKFITPAKDEPVAAKVKESASAKKKGGKPDKAAPAPAVTIDELVAADFLGYTSAWEFVAERFHCDEAFLHHINPQIKGTPVVGTEFQVPNVVPFEIEKALDTPLQPVADPQKPVVAAIVLLSRLEIWREGKLTAALPLVSARPGLRGRDKWTVLDAIPQPRMATKREPREVPKQQPAPAADAAAVAKPVIEAPLEKEQYLASGPNNPVGIIWISLGKAGSTDPLPYGLHGTSIPAKMKLEGIGGLRLTNWDIARAVRLMPSGTVLQWRAK